jgi:putative chitinase
MDRKVFFDRIRPMFAGDRLSAVQVAGLEAILDEGERRGTSVELMGYLLATPHHETGRNMAPNTENLNYTTAARIRQVWPSRFPTIASAKPFVRNAKALANKVYNGRMGNRVGTDDGWNFRGRGLPHLTGADNYRKASKATGVDLVKDPDRATELPIAVKVLFDGMLGGWFTGKSLRAYVSEHAVDYVNARRVVNGVDEAHKIAGYAAQYVSALKAAKYGTATKPTPAPTAKPKQDVPAPAEPPASSGAKTGVFIVLLAALAAFGAWVASLPCSILGVLC